MNLMWQKRKTSFMHLEVGFFLLIFWAFYSQYSKRTNFEEIFSPNRRPKCRQRQSIWTSACARRNALRTYRRDYSNIYENLEQSGDRDKMQQRSSRSRKWNEETSSNDDIIQVCSIADRMKYSGVGWWFLECRVRLLMESSTLIECFNSLSFNC